MRFAKGSATVLLFILLLPLSSFAGDLQTPGFTQPTDQITVTGTTNTSTNQQQTTAQVTTTTQVTTNSTQLDALIVQALNVLLATMKP